MNEIDSIIGNKEKLESKTYKEIKESNDRVNKVGDIFEHGQAISPIIKKVENRIRAVSYTHLTLPTNREV